MFAWGYLQSAHPFLFLINYMQYRCTADWITLKNQKRGITRMTRKINKLNIKLNSKYRIKGNVF